MVQYDVRCEIWVLRLPIDHIYDQGGIFSTGVRWRAKASIWALREHGGPDGRHFNLRFYVALYVYRRMRDRSVPMPSMVADPDVKRRFQTTGDAGSRIDIIALFGLSEFSEPAFRRCKQDIGAV